MAPDEPRISFTLDGSAVEVAPGATLLDTLRDQLGMTVVKDGCSPQGQCGCCTVLVDGQARVACVTPVRRVHGRQVTTLNGLDPVRRQAWASAFCATGASQCGFCTPGIIVRLDALAQQAARQQSGSGHGPVKQALLAHLCRCTGWQTILEAWDRFDPTDTDGPPRDLAAAARRAELEGGTAQRVGPEVAMGQGGFAADTAPPDALMALSDGAGGWAVGESLAHARAQLHKIQGRRTTVAHSWPLAVPEGNWDVTLRTTWVEPAYLEPDASWCQPAGEPSSAVANGGAFGAKLSSPVLAASRELADRYGRPVLVLGSREDVTRWGPKRPPVAGGARSDGMGWLRVVETPGIAEAVAVVAPGLRVEEIAVPGPPTSNQIRAAGWAEALILTAAARPDDGPLAAPNGSVAEAQVKDGVIKVTVRCGQVLDDVVLRSYCIGAAHMAWSWVTSEALTVDGEGRPVDLTVRSFGVARAIDTPPIEITIDSSDTSPAVNGSEAVFVAVAAATWRAAGHPPEWPVGSIAGF